ncbi:MAG TPA: phosphoglycerate kinase [Sporichthyaceae bacterium]|jgi:phosphoglycerate kinase|nr:phosphoglycerate kinase [Sporichthyaceae bacterium]
MRNIDDLGDLRGRRVLVRCDLNVPLAAAPEAGAPDGARRITDDGRIRASLPVLTELTARGARVVVCSHLGRPKGEAVPGLSLAPVAARLGELSGLPVRFSPAVSGPEAAQVVADLTDGQVAVLENVRFVAGETSKDDAERGAFAAELAALADAYVGDAFGAVHRKHASVYDVPRLLPHAAGPLVRAEVEVLRRLTEDPQRPYTVVLGGSKVSDKLAVIDRLLAVADRILVGGGMVFTFLAAQGYEVGTSLLEVGQLDTVRGYLAQAAAQGVELVLPTDIVAADRFAADADVIVVPADAMPADRMGLDIGPASAATFAAALADSATTFWNGPMGVFEMDAFAAGTRAVAQALVDGKGFSVVGGGDSAAAVRRLGFPDDAFGHISTGGGASLEYLEGKRLPGLEALEV